MYITIYMTTQGWYSGIKISYVHNYWKIKEEKGYMMRQILIATHGKMASGIRYTLELVVGKMDEITTIDAYVNPEDDVEKMLEEYFLFMKGRGLLRLRI